MSAADIRCVRPVTTPLVRIDPGWFFILPGVVMLAACMLIPAYLDLLHMRDQFRLLEYQERVICERLAGYDQFLYELDRGDEAVLRRLAVTQLNVMPEGEQPILMAGTFDAPVTAWIEATVREVAPPPVPKPQSTLVEIVTGSHRLWVIAASVMCVFVGLLLKPDRDPACVDADAPS